MRRRSLNGSVEWEARCAGGEEGEEEGEGETKVEGAGFFLDKSAMPRH